MIKIISGERRGTKLQTLEGNDTRPLRGRVRESLFDIIRPTISGAVIWDLFAGSGGVGLEALSQGAESALFIEPGRPALKIIRANIEKLRYENKSKVIEGKSPESLKLIPETYRKPDIVFMMPPYYSGLALDVFQYLDKNDFDISEDTCFIVETHRKEEDISHPNFEIIDDRQYGVTRLSFFKYNQTT